MYRSPADRKAEAARMQQLTEDTVKQRTAQGTAQGQYSDMRIIKRNGDIPHHFLSDIGGSNSNYR